MSKRRSNKRRDLISNHRLPFGFFDTFTRTIIPVSPGLLSQISPSRFSSTGSRSVFKNKSRSQLISDQNVNVSQKNNRDRFANLRSLPDTSGAIALGDRQKQQTKSICQFRQERREIMHATGNAGRSGQKSPVWTSASYKKCRRS